MKEEETERERERREGKERDREKLELKSGNSTQGKELEEQSIDELYHKEMF